MKKLICFLTIVFLSSVFAGCTASSTGGSTTPEQTTDPPVVEPPVATAPAGPTVAIQMQTPKSGDYIAVIDTSMGTIKVVLYPEYAPKTVENFLTHADEGYYDGLIFHRIIENFMIQGGDPLGTGMGGESIWGEPFDIEPSGALHHIRGALAMARRGNTTASQRSQFYIVQGKPVNEDLIAQMRSYSAEEGWGDAIANAYAEVGGDPSLDFKYTVFGQVYEGMDVVDAIAAVETDGNKKPLSDVVINSITTGKYE